MPPDPPTNVAPTRKRGKRPKTPQLKVVFDTNALYVTPATAGSASDLLRHEISELIAGSKYPDLDIVWYIPSIVRHERQYQMQTEALKLRSAINKIERLLDHKLALTDQALLDRVEAMINHRKVELNLQELQLDHTAIDWPSLIYAAEYRIPPFEGGDKEKGFRDALIAESFLQLLSSSPKTPALCRVVLVTSDGLLTQAVKNRIADSTNASVLQNIEELKGLINTLVSNVGEDFIARLKPKAAKLFFVSGDDKDVLYFKEKIGERIREKFGSQLDHRPGGTTFRQNVKWLIAPPNFSRKEGRKIFWTSRVEIQVKAGITTLDQGVSAGVPAQTLSTSANIALTNPIYYSSAAYSSPTYYGFDVNNVSLSDKLPDWSYLINTPSPRKITTHQGTDLFEVLWSAELTMSNDLKKASVEDVRHVEFKCQPASQS
jgi:hypothetical protein